MLTSEAEEKKLLVLIDSNRVEVFIDTVTLSCGTFTVNQSYQLNGYKSHLISDEILGDLMPWNMAQKQ